MTFPKDLFHQLELLQEKPLFFEIRGSAELEISSTSLLEDIRRLRLWLRTQPITKGDRIALVAMNSARWVACDLAFLAEGLISVPLYSRQSLPELIGILQDCTPKLTLIETPSLRNALLQEGKTLPGAFFDLQEAFSLTLNGEEKELPLIPLDPNDPITLIYTSGTSGEPKGVLWTTKNADYMVPATRDALEAIPDLDPKTEKAFHYLPFCFAGSRILLWTQLSRGVPLRLSTDLSQLSEELRQVQPDYCLNVPALLERIRQKVKEQILQKGSLIRFLYQRVQKKNNSLFRQWIGTLLFFKKIKKQLGFKFLICGSAPLAEETQEWFHRIGIPVYQVYGLTETTAIITMDRPPYQEPGKVGYPLTGCEVQLSPDQELLCRGPNVFSGYWNRPEATAEVLREGWFHTGDQAEVDEKGNYRIVGRLKNLFVLRSGHKVPPEPLEQKVLEAYPLFGQVLLEGDQRSCLTLLYTGEVSSEQAQVALDALNKELPHYKKIHKSARLPVSFSTENGLLTANQKLKRSAIRERFSTIIEELYPHD